MDWRNIDWQATQWETIDWRPVIAELVQLGGLTQKDIAEACGKSQSVISDLATKPGVDPGFAFGSRMLELHWQHVGSRVGEAA